MKRPGVARFLLNGMAQHRGRIIRRDHLPPRESLRRQLRRHAGGGWVRRWERHPHEGGDL